MVHVLIHHHTLASEQPCITQASNSQAAPHIQKQLI